MQQQRKTGLIFIAFLLFGVCIGLVWAKPAVIVGMVTETRGQAYWQNDSKKNRVQELAELPVNAKLVLIKGSKLTVVYLASGQQYELNGPALVQFKNAKPVALSGTMPMTIGAAPVLTEKKRIDPKSVQTAGQTLVSTEAKADPNFPVAVTAPPPPPPPPAPMPPPAMMVPSPRPSPAMTPDAIATAQARERMEAYEAEMMAAQQARAAESASQIAEREAAKAAAAKSAEINAEKKAAESKPDIPCPPPTSNDGSVQAKVAKCSDIED